MHIFKVYIYTLEKVPKNEKKWSNLYFKKLETKDDIKLKEISKENIKIRAETTPGLHDFTIKFFWISKKE